MKYTGQGIGVLLIEEGLAPKNCRNIELIIPADGAVIVRFEVFFDSGDIPKIQRVLAKILEEESARVAASAETKRS